MAALGPVPESYQVNLAGCTAVFCDVDYYPTAERTTKMAMEGISVAIGVHPKAHSLTEEEKMKFAVALGHPDVVALGEIGLDYTTPYSEWLNQERQFADLLRYAQTKNVIVVLHLRGMTTDNVGRYAYLRGLAVAAETLGRPQPFHLHCFTGPPDVVEAWLKRFPNTHFGFTNAVESFNFIQREGLKTVPNNRLLLESDAPYFKPQNYLCNAPCLLGYTASHVARIRGEAYEEVLAQTTTNANRLYGGAIGDP